MFCQLQRNVGYKEVFRMGLGMDLSVRLQEGKGCLNLPNNNQCGFYPTFARKITAFERKEMGLILRKINSARRSRQPSAW